MRILVTGGFGFIGSNLVRALVREHKAHVLNLDKMGHGANPASLSDLGHDALHTHKKIDILDRGAVDAAIAAFRPDAVMHLAAESHVDRSITGSQSFIETNIVGTYHLLEAVRAYWLGLDNAGRAAFRFLHVSTDEVYGDLGVDDPGFTEKTAYAPSSPYSASKAASDHLVRAWGRTYGLPFLVTNCSNNYGPYQHPEKLIPRMILSALAGQNLPVYGKGDQIRDWLHVRDHVSALWTVLTAGKVGETYNVGGHNEWRNLDVVKTICRILDDMRPGQKPHEKLVSFVTDRPGHDYRYAIDGTKIKTELKWSPTMDFETGLRDTVEWYVANENWWADPSHATHHKKAMSS